MWRATQGTDYNGIVLFEPGRLREFYGGRIRRGRNLFARFTKTEDGDAVLRRGIVVPILAIDDGGYSIIVRDAHEPSPVERDVILTNGVYPLRVRDRVVIADLVVMREWQDETDWRDVPIAPGTYGVTVRGFRKMARRQRKIIDAGYELVLARTSRLPRVTANTGAKMRTLKLDT